MHVFHAQAKAEYIVLHRTLSNQTTIARPSLKGARPFMLDDAVAVLTNILFRLWLVAIAVLCGLAADLGWWSLTVVFNSLTLVIAPLTVYLVVKGLVALYLQLCSKGQQSAVNRWLQDWIWPEETWVRFLAGHRALGNHDRLLSRRRKCAIFPRGTATRRH